MNKNSKEMSFLLNLLGLLFNVYNYGLSFLRENIILLSLVLVILGQKIFEFVYAIEYFESYKSIKGRL
jgi:hypothetical protein